MARDPGLEELVREHLGFEPGLVEAAMFGGRAWLLDGNLLCAASGKGLMVRLGKGNDGWALKRSGVAQMSAGHPMAGWVRADADAYGDDDLRTKLLSAALAFTRALPPKEPQ
ncbi:TfoX/Sxy family protein [Phenylobacterium immobile]|uniref:TfoX/Sxy family protein n=1 Tax=Phenylobacterium immobile TaxID=21 RepID=UPI000AB5D8FF|nr:TfoX/Sxy family protein [Phenylobacterium immobile]